MALDEPTDLDEVVESEGYTFAMEKKLFDEAKPLTIDMTYMGFNIISSLPLGEGGCGTSCSGGSCSV